MNLTIQIHCITDIGNKVLQRGSFQTRGRSLERAAFDCWKEIKREMNVEIKLEKVIVDGEDFTDKVKELEIISRI